MKNKICKILNDIRPEYDFSIEKNYIETGMLDSFDVVVLVTALEEEFGVFIDGMDIVPENFSSLDAIEKILIKSGFQK